MLAGRPGTTEISAGGRRHAHPRIVRQMLTKRSAPHPAIAATPAGGTILSQWDLLEEHSSFGLQRTVMMIRRIPEIMMAVFGVLLHFKFKKISRERERMCFSYGRSLALKG